MLRTLGLANFSFGISRHPVPRANGIAKATTSTSSRVPRFVVSLHLSGRHVLELDSRAQGFRARKMVWRIIFLGLLIFIGGPNGKWVVGQQANVDPKSGPQIPEVLRREFLEKLSRLSSPKAEENGRRGESLSNDELVPQRLGELLPLILDPSPSDRHRFYLPDLSPRGNQRRERLRASLREWGLLDDLIELLVAQRELWQLTLRERDGQRIDPHYLDSLDFLINDLRNESASSGVRERNAFVEARDPPSVQAKRSSMNIPLLTWGPGSYSVARTKHFWIASQAGDKPTLEMAQACESILSLWKELFSDRFTVGFRGVENGDASIGDPTAFRVVLFRNREAYVRALKSLEPRINISTGYYSPTYRLAFFYWDGAKSLPTLVHELTHQFFDHCGREGAGFDANSDAGFWAIEGISLYMESWSEESLGRLRIVDIGGWDSPRLQAGRFRRLRDQYWIPWEEFSAANGQRVRSDPEIAAWYSQACGLTHAFMDRDPSTRDRFLDYLIEVNRHRGGEAAEALGTDDDIRSEYDRTLLRGDQSSGDPFSTRYAMPRRNEIVLTRCSVTSETLLEWPAACRKLAWLDLGFTQVDDSLFQGTPSGSQKGPQDSKFEGNNEKFTWDVVRLNLESTKITDASLPEISKMRSLTELDLTGCEITDAGLESLARHPTLKQLWIGGTKVTDRSIEVLSSIPRLERLDATGVLSEEGALMLSKKKPGLKKP